MADSRERTLFCGNLDDLTTEELLYELFIQAGPVEQIKIPVADGRPKGFGFITYCHAESVPYAMELLSDVKLFGRTLRIQFRSGSSRENQGRQMDFQQHQQQQRYPQIQQGYMMANMQPMQYEQPMVMPGMRVVMQPGVPMMAAYNPLCPPMAAVLQGTGFHRSFSAPDVGQFTQVKYAGALMDQHVDRPDGDNSSTGATEKGLVNQNVNRISDSGRGSRDSSPYSRDYSPDPRQDSRERNLRGHERKRSHDDRSRRSPTDDRYSRRDHRSGDDYRDRSREGRWSQEQRHHSRDDRGRDHAQRTVRDYRHGDDAHMESGPGDRDRGRDRDRSVDSGRSRRDASTEQPSQATLNFRRQMVSPPWKRSTPPWQ